MKTARITPLFVEHRKGRHTLVCGVTFWEGDSFAESRRMWFSADLTAGDIMERVREDYGLDQVVFQFPMMLQLRQADEELPF